MSDQQMVGASQRRRSQYKWTAPQTEMLRQLFATGMSCERIAAEINRQFSTNYTAGGVTSHAYLTLKLRRPGPSDGWTDERNDELRLRVASGMTFGRIGSAMGVSRSVVRGQVRRLDIRVPRYFNVPFEQRRTPEEQAAFGNWQARRDAALRLERRLTRLLNFVPRQYRQETLLPPVPVVVADPLNLTLMEVGRMQCRWITNDDMAAPLYCGHPIEKGSWCAAHREVVKQPSMDDQAEGDHDGIWKSSVLVSA